jgi:hypothetical protein
LSFFRNINKAPETNNEDEINLPDIDNNLINNLNNEINGENTSEEIVSCVNNLKNDKASGDDFIVNEYIKSSTDIILPVYIKMFNCIFSSGIVPDSWLLGNIKPIYKNKVVPWNPKIVRPTTILSCFGKLCTSILLRERPFNLKGVGVWFFSKKILIPNVAEKNILILVEEK